MVQSFPRRTKTHPPPPIRTVYGCSGIPSAGVPLKSNCETPTKLDLCPHFNASGDLATNSNPPLVTTNIPSTPSNLPSLQAPQDPAESLPGTGEDSHGRHFDRSVDSQSHGVALAGLLHRAPPRETSPSQVGGQTFTMGCHIGSTRSDRRTISSMGPTSSPTSTSVRPDTNEGQTI